MYRILIVDDEQAKYSIFSRHQNNYHHNEGTCRVFEKITGKGV